LLELKPPSAFGQSQQPGDMYESFKDSRKKDLERQGYFPFRR
jgi:hypothetical protein